MSSLGGFKGLSLEHVRAVLNIPDVTDPLGIRDRAILETFYSTGMRRSELTALDIGDLDAAAQTIHIRKGKGGKGRMVPVGTLRCIGSKPILKEPVRSCLSMPVNKPFSLAATGSA
jgi:integrase/recombinase XerD